MQNFLTAFAETFRAGGILMAPLTVLAFYLYFSGIGLCARLAKIKRICDSDGLFRSAFEEFPEGAIWRATPRQSSRASEWS